MFYGRKYIYPRSDGQDITQANTSLEEFRMKCGRDQSEHIDITSAPSYAKWKRCCHWAKSISHETPSDLGSVGATLAHENRRSKSYEYADAICKELGLTPKVNQGKFKGAEWDIEELYNRLPKGE